MRYQVQILNHGIYGYEVWLHGRNQGRSGVKHQTCDTGPEMSFCYFPNAGITSDVISTNMETLT